MRKGLNPNKDKKSEKSRYLHQVVIPVYIPNLKGYFSDSFAILKYCIKSLLKTSHNSTFISIVNNGSCEEVVNYLNDLLVAQSIQELIHSENIGKINAVSKGLIGHDLPLVTISDADVLFLSGWQEATYEIFENFPKAGVVGLTPQFKAYERFCGNVIAEKFFSRNLCFEDVKNPEGLKSFYRSVGWDDTYNKDYLKKILCIKNGNFQAVVGSGHYVATYRREIFSQVANYHDAKLGIDSERNLDIIPLKKGLWRLTTSNNFAYHMGNVKEEWMKRELNLLQKPKERKTIDLHPLQGRGENKIFGFLKNRVAVKIFSSKMTKKIFYKLKNLPKEMRTNY